MGLVKPTKIYDNWTSRIVKQRVPFLMKAAGFKVQVDYFKTRSQVGNPHTVTPNRLRRQITPPMFDQS